MVHYLVLMRTEKPKLILVEVSVGSNKIPKPSTVTF